MIRTSLLLLLLGVSIAQPPRVCAEKPGLPERYDKWLTQDVTYIAAEEERKEFLSLTSDSERDAYIEQFWKRRDPDPATEVNEFRREHYARIQYANDHFNDGKPGWKAARGRVYIMHGPPDTISYNMGGAPLQIDVEQPTEVIIDQSSGDRQRRYRLSFTTPETEIWIYRHLPGARNATSYFEVVFSRIDPSQLYSLSQTMHQISSSANLTYQQRLQRDWAIMHFFRGQMIGGEFRILYSGEYRYQDIDDFYQSVFHPMRLPSVSMTDFQMGLSDLERSPGELIVERLKLNRKLREEVGTHAYFRELPLRVDYGFLQAETGHTMMPFTLAFGPAKDFSGTEATARGGHRQIDLLVELLAPNGEAVASWTDRIGTNAAKGPQPSGADGWHLYQARLSARPGTYQFRVYALEPADGAAATWSNPVTLPDYTGKQLVLSELMLFSEVVRRSEWKESEEGRFLASRILSGGSAPLQIKDYVLFPAVGRRFRRRQNLTAFVEVYNPYVDSDKRPDIRLHCRIRQSGAVVSEVPEKELQYLTQSVLNKTTYGISIPLKGFAVGEYQLELEVVDGPENRSVSRSANFTIF